MKRVMIAGTNSGCGKTTITCALLSALKQRGIWATAFKCGPDYIDPMFHRAIYGIKAYNLDPFLLEGDALNRHIRTYAGEFSLIEGAMGYYDGIATTDAASAYTVARETQTPVILVISAKGAGHSLGALIEGFVNHRKDCSINGVIFNDASKSRYRDLEDIAKASGVEFLGIMPRSDNWEIPSRHLGLLTAAEICDLQTKLHTLGEQAEQTLDIDNIILLASTAPVLEKKNCLEKNLVLEERDTKTKNQKLPPEKLRLAIAKDEAFCFHYQENLELLNKLNCELVFFSPLRDSSLPANINGIYLSGGYPEIHAQALSANKTMLYNIKEAISKGLPTIAESGGFLYLHENLGDVPMCGIIPGAAFRTKKLQRFGYITLIAKADNLLCKSGETIRAHEFHYWDSTNCGDSFTAEKAGREIRYSCVHGTENLYAGFPQLYFPSNPYIAKNFVERMMLFAR